ncbi:hypothetical protein SH203_01879 [Brevundimonas sp. SH203]|uniref:hypothetical protein n=1 Tax=Brevundimonas sp. SH203 TaxID=345167 RepID=UPI0009CC9794|nr:hypothetical protein [Brevundimonas sp. SH203]GAW41473.1 hypothetical protein SH203_01879 [Brevundimonas sp. SH203]
MSRKPASLIVAARPAIMAPIMALIMALAFAPVLTTQAVAQSRDQAQPSPDRGPRVSPDEARRRGGEAGGGRPIDTQPRRDGNYSVLVERDGRVREVVVDGQTGQARQGGPDNAQRRRPN